MRITLPGDSTDSWGSVVLRRAPPTGTRTVSSGWSDGVGSDMAANLPGPVHPPATPTSRGTSISSSVSDPCRPTRTYGPGVVRVVERHRALGGEQHVAEAARGRVGDRRAVPALRDGLLPRAHPRVLAEPRLRRLMERGGPPGTRVQPAEPALARTACATWVSTSLGSSTTSSPGLDLAVVGRDRQRRAGGQQLEQRGDEVVDPAQLLVVLARRGRTRGTPCRAPRSTRTRTARRPGRGAPARP